MPTYSLAELAKLADVTPRTIRFYIAQGLLHSPGQQGPATRYTDEHLSRLLAIKKLQASHLPLAEIRQHLRAVPPDEVGRVAEARGPEPTAAIDYIRGVLSPARRLPSIPTPAMPTSAVPTPAMPASPAPSQATAVAGQTEPGRSQWERVSLDPDIELHIRRPLTRHQNKRVERLIAIARELLEED